MQNQTVLWVVQQAMTEMGLPKPESAVSNNDETVRQIVALFNHAGMELVIGFPWEQLIKEWVFTTDTGTQNGKVFEYTLPSDWSYFLDQTQWDRTNHWPLLGPKTAQEWQWIKSGILSTGPRLRYRVVGGHFELFPAQADTSLSWNIAMEYVSDGWLMDTEIANTFYSMAQQDTNVVMLDPWIMVAFVKLKFWEAKGLNTAAYTKDITNLWEARIGKNKGAPVLSLSPRPTTILIGVNNIPDGSWNTMGVP